VYFARLRVPEGWLITSVRDRRNGTAYQRLDEPATRFAGFVRPGTLDIEVTREHASDRRGVLRVLLVGNTGILQGSGIYPLG
jgi:hypothetical protein